MARVLVATPEPIADKMAGPAIRAAHIARVLRSRHDVELVSLAGESTDPISGVRVENPDSIDPGRYDAAVIQGKVLLDHPQLEASSLPLVIDWFDPFHLEALHRGSHDNILRSDLIEGARRTLLAQAARGDLFLCSNEEQRQHWLGWLSAAGRVNRHTHDSDSNLANLLTVAPFGLDKSVARAKGPSASPIHQMFPDIQWEDPVLVWSGGLHDWLDPVSVVRAMPTVLDQNPDSRLVFLAGPHPNTSIETMGIRGEAIEAARDLRLFGRHVLFVNQWIPYDQRLDWLAGATIGVIAHHDHLEARLSHRTRLLDHLAAGLPTVSTSGDPASAIWAAAGAAELAPPGDVDALGKAIAALVANEEDRQAMSRAAGELARSMSWEQTLGPLVEWVEEPRRAADMARAHRSLHQPVESAGELRRTLARARMHLDDGGLKQLLARSLAAARRRLSR